MVRPWLALSASALFAAMLLQSQLAQAQLAVSSSGQATASIPIVVPPGIAGMTPNLSLLYADGGISAHLGAGWSLQGISMITRCPAVRSIDNRPRSVEFLPTDKLCLDGQRLVPVDGSGAPTTIALGDASGVPVGTPYWEYRTERGTYARIRAYGRADGLGGSGGLAANGPATFKVWTKAGQIYEYGTSPNGISNALIYPFNATASPPAPRPVVAVWAVSRISDVRSNHIDFKYISALPLWASGDTAAGYQGFEWGLAEVQFTGNTASLQAPANKVVLEYETRFTPSTVGFDNAEAYQYDNKSSLTYRIKAIRSYINSPNPGVLGPAAGAIKVRTTKMTYEQSPATGRSRLTSVQDCLGATETLCLPARTYAYSPSTAPPLTFTANTSFNAVLGTLRMTDTSGAYGVLTGDFDGDGRTDIIRWSHNAAENELWLSQGGGNFSKSAAYNLTLTVLFSADGCYSSIVADFNGDGLSDILRPGKASCGNSGSVLLLTQGNGTFVNVTPPSAMDLEQIKPNSSSGSTECTPIPIIAPPTSSTQRARPVVTPPLERYGTPGVARAPVAAGQAQPAPAAGSCILYTRSLGRRFYVLDLDGDGVLDIVTTVAVDYSWNSGWGPTPNETQLCLGLGNPSFSGPCSQVFRGLAGGGFTEVTTTNIANTSVYVDPPSRSTGIGQFANPYWRIPDLADLDGDGLLDILAGRNGRFRSTGDFNFVVSSSADPTAACTVPIDFNGDGRGDCLWPAAVATDQRLRLSFGAAPSPNIVQFNLSAANDNLYAEDALKRQTVGVVVDDFDGDGRQDILRWGPSTADNGIYLSNGNGSFRTRAAAGLDAIARPLSAPDATATFALGDFLGTGAAQILHLKHNPTAGADPATSNQLYARTYAPLDTLASATTGNALATTVNARVPLSNSGGRYLSERGVAGEAAVAPRVDVQPPMYVISGITQQTGAGSLTTEYLYKGLKAELGGRGLLGFREVRQMTPTPDVANSTMTVVNEYLLGHPYGGAAARSRTYIGAGLSPAVGATVSSQTTNVYCEKLVEAQQGSATFSAPCPLPVQSAPSPRVVRPYLYQSVETGVDVGPNAVGTITNFTLPTVTTTNTFNLYGDPTQIVVVTSGPVAGVTRTYTKTTTNTFCTPNSGGCPNVIDDNRWILGRLTRATVNSVTPDLTAVPAATAGTAPKATATQGP